MERGCGNTFVVLPPFTAKGSVIFGKNSNRPAGEVQELIYEPPKQHSAGESLKCTYIEIQQTASTHGVILSKPHWMWGCDMGANDQGVVIGNEVVPTRSKIIFQNGLLATDLVRLALERSKSAEESIKVISDLLAKYGQGGNLFQGNLNLDCHSSFLIADPNEAWVMEVADNQWVAQKISSGYRHLSSNFSIETQFDKFSPELKTFAKENGYWKGEGEFNFASVFNNGNEGKNSTCSQNLLKKHLEKNNFNVKQMLDVLRDEENGICNNLKTLFPTSSSQVSVLSRSKPCCHWFTATPDPTVSVFKPFIFTPNVKISSCTEIQGNEDSHVLHGLHAAATSNSSNKVIPLLQKMEQNCLEEVEKFLEDYRDGQSLSELDELLKDVVETEVKFYK